MRIQVFAFIAMVNLAGCSPSAALHEKQKASSPQVYRGMLRVVFSDGVEAGRLDQPDGTCLGVSLPKHELARLRRSGLRQVSLRGLMSEVPDNVEIATIRINGRVVGFRQCKNKYVYVRDSRDIVWQEE